jgi:ribosomal protein S18 acetylase RimI-like enzyme
MVSYSVSDFIIREGTAKEHKAIAELVHSLFPSSDPKFHKTDLVLVAESNSSFVGFIHFSFIGGKTILRGLGVKQEYRNKGLGKQLLSAGIAKLPSASAIYLKVKSDNQSALSIYLQNGFIQKKTDGGTFVLVKLPDN